MRSLVKRFPKISATAAFIAVGGSSVKANDAINGSAKRNLHADHSLLYQQIIEIVVSAEKRTTRSGSYRRESDPLESTE